MHKILICDDDRDIVNALKLYLADPDYCFYEAYDGEQAVEIVNNEKIDLILLDIMMPKTDGIKAMSLIREKHNIPVILLTAKSEESDIVLGLNVGADDYISDAASKYVLSLDKIDFSRDGISHLNIIDFLLGKKDIILI